MRYIVRRLRVKGGVRVWVWRPKIVRESQESQDSLILSTTTVTVLVLVLVLDIY